MMCAGAFHDSCSSSFIIEPTKVIESSLRSIQFVDNDGNPVDYRGQPLDAEDPDGRERYWTDRIGAGDSRA